jgi:hypothetical protein
VTLIETSQIEQHDRTSILFTNVWNIWVGWWSWYCKFISPHSVDMQVKTSYN